MLIQACHQMNSEYILKILSNPIKTHDSLYPVPLNDSEIRKIGAACFLTQALAMAFIRIPLRIFQLFKGDFVKSGCQIGDEKWVFDCLKIDKDLSYNCYVGKEIFKQLIINIVQIVTYPLAIISFQFASLFMILAPSVGQKMWATTEHFWSRKGNLYEIGSIALTDYSLPCLQKVDVWDSHDLYPALQYYKYNSIRSSLLTLSKYQKRYQAVLKGDSHDLFVTVGRHVALYQKFIKVISTNNQLDPPDVASKIFTIWRTLEHIVALHFMYPGVLEDNEKAQYLEDKQSIFRALGELNVQYCEKNIMPDAAYELLFNRIMADVAEHNKYHKVNATHKSIDSKAVQKCTKLRAKVNDNINRIRKNPFNPRLLREFESLKASHSH